MNRSHARQRARARHLIPLLRCFLPLPLGVAACSVYESSLVATGSGLDAGGHGNGGASGNGRANAGDGKGAAAGSATSSGSEAGTATQAAGVGGTTSSAGQPGVGHAGSAPLEDAGGAGGEPTVTLELLDDMEDGDAFVASTKGRNGHWDVSNDATPAASQAPTPANFAMAEFVDPARPDSQFAAYTKGNGFKDWGAFMTVSTRTWPDYDKTPTYDAGAYSGIVFFAKAGVGSDLNLRVRFIGAQTDARGGQCTPGGSIDAACYDHFYADVKLSQAWQRIELSFADFQQAGVGKSFPSIDLSTMYALEFFFPGRKTASGNAFELWVDDLSFIVAPAPR